MGPKSPFIKVCLDWVFLGFSILNLVLHEETLLVSGLVQWYPQEPLYILNIILKDGQVIWLANQNSVLKNLNVIKTGVHIKKETKLFYKDL